MHVYYWIPALFLSGLSTVTAFNDARDSCVPPEDVFKAHSDARVCDVVSRFSGAYQYSCTDSGTALLDHKANKIRMSIGANGSERTLTVHGKCLTSGTQSAHFDLHVAIPAGEAYMQYFPAFNRACNVDAGSTITLFHYVMTPGQQAECARHPISPSSG